MCLVKVRESEKLRVGVILLFILFIKYVFWREIGLGSGSFGVYLFFVVWVFFYFDWNFRVLSDIVFIFLGVS